jgi:putative holliday junction resolvase
MNKVYRILGIDYGTVRIGLALSDPMRIIASGLKTILNDNFAINEILQIISVQDVEKIIVGMPFNLKGEVSTKAKEVLRFIQLLKEKTDKDIISFDERFTSVMAQQAILTMGTPKKKRQNNKGKVDQIAAAILLQNYLDFVKR